MNLGPLLEVMQELGLKKIRVRSEWVQAECPFPERHAKGYDSHPSFDVKIAPDGQSGFLCFACHAESPNLLVLVWRRLLSTPRELPRLQLLFDKIRTQDRAMLAAKAFMGGREDPPRMSLSSTGRQVPPFVSRFVAPPMGEGKALTLVSSFPEAVELPEDTLGSMRKMPQAVSSYLSSRRLTQASVAGWELGFDRGRIMIPIRDRRGRLVGLSGRKFNPSDNGPKYLHSKGFKRDLVLYGEHKLVEGRTGYVVEGFFDVIGLCQNGYNAVALMGSYPSRVQVEKMARYFTDVVVVPDGDKAGKDMASKVLMAVRPYLPVRVVGMPEGKDPDELDPDELVSLLGPPNIDYRQVVC